MFTDNCGPAQQSVAVCVCVCPSVSLPIRLCVRTITLELNDVQVDIWHSGSQSNGEYTLSLCDKLASEYHVVSNARKSTHVLLVQICWNQ